MIYQEISPVLIPVIAIEYIYPSLEILQIVTKSLREIENNNCNVNIPTYLSN